MFKNKINKINTIKYNKIKSSQLKKKKNNKKLKVEHCELWDSDILCKCIMLTTFGISFIIMYYSVSHVLTVFFK